VDKRERESMCERAPERKRESEWATAREYGVATVIRIDKMIGLFCRISSLL